MFQSDEQRAMSGGRCRAQIVSGQLRQKSHEREVREALDEGSASGWHLVSATTTNASGTFVTGIYWDTTPGR